MEEGSLRGREGLKEVKRALEEFAGNKEEVGKKMSGSNDGQQYLDVHFFNDLTRTHRGQYPIRHGVMSMCPSVLLSGALLSV